MNWLYIGIPSDINIGNGKSGSAVYDTLRDWALEPHRPIFSNVELMGVPYTRFTPDNIDEVLETYEALVILDEIHAIVHKNHKITETCKHHGDNIGLCYKIAQFLRQVRKRRIRTRSTAQTFHDCHMQYRVMMNMQVECEKFHILNGKLVKCKPDYKHGNIECPDWHKHIIKQDHYPKSQYEPSQYVDISPIYENYNSLEIVKGWV